MRIVAAFCAGLILAACVEREALRLFPDIDAPRAEEADWPDLVDAVTAAEAVGPPPASARGEAIAEDLTLEAAIMRDRAERLSGPVFEVEPLRAEAAAARAGRGGWASPSP